MTTYEVQRAIAIHIINLVAAIFFCCVICYSRAKDDSDQRAACVQAAEQQRQTAQPETWAKLDVKGRAMVAFDGITKNGGIR